MNEENILIIKQLNKFGRVPETSELLKMIEDLQNNWNELKKWLEEEIEHNVDGIKSFSGYQCKQTLDKMQELEGNNER